MKNSIADSSRSSFPAQIYGMSVLSYHILAVMPSRRLVDYYRQPVLQHMQVYVYRWGLSVGSLEESYVASRIVL